MLRFEETKVKNETFYDIKKPMKIWAVDVDNKVISKLIKQKLDLSISLYI